MPLRALLMATLFPVLAVHASDIPKPGSLAGVGVNIHFIRGHEKDLDLIAAAGFKYVREDFFWDLIEKKRGEYNWSDFDELTANLEKRGLHPYYILDYSNPLYEEPGRATNPITHKLEHSAIASPQHPESVDAFARWAAAAARHYHGHAIVWEIWNEPNISFWKPKADVAQYTALAVATCRAIREAEPDATIVGPATSGFAAGFMDYFCKSGVLQYLDAVSVHPYRPPSVPPETAGREFEHLRGLIKQYAPEGKKDLPIVSGEWGYSSNTKGVTLEQQANFIARQQLANLYYGIPISIWYDWKNDGNDPNENEHNFGVVKPDLSPKPAYTAIQTLTRELAGCQLAGRCDIGDTNVFVLVFNKGGRQSKLAVWTTGTNFIVHLPFAKISTNSITVINGNGVPMIGDLPPLWLMNGAPQYVDLHGHEVPVK